MKRPILRLPSACAAFTLVELLVVISIIGLLIAILVPSLSKARAQATAVKCGANLHHVGIGLVLYSTENADYVVPSYNLPWAAGAGANFTGGPDQPLDGWAPILDRDGVVPTNERDTNTTFFCPKTVDVEGMKDGQTGTDLQKPRGWTDWPLKFTTTGGDSSPKVAVTIPALGFRKIIRVSYWINAYNPVGNRPADIAAADLHYTASVGLGPDNSGQFITLHRANAYRSAMFIVAADGIYMGRQGVSRLGDANSRIGYRHPGMSRPNGLANIAFADGHVGAILGGRFPRALGTTDPADLVEEKIMENLAGPTVYSDPRKLMSQLTAVVP